MPHKNSFQLFFLATLCLLMVGVAHAQGTGQPDPIQYTVASETPGPNELVYISIAGVGSFLGNSTVTWEKNGEVVSTGVGKTSYMFRTGGVGSVVQVSVTISSVTHGTFTHDFVFNPSAVTLLWEADTTVPPLYVGKPLYTAGSKLTVFAFPTVLIGGALVPSNKLSFQWVRGEQLDPEGSGLGRSSYSFYGDQLHNSEEVSVDMYYNGIKIGRGEISIPASDPLVLFYNKDPLRGVLFDQALPNAITFDKKEFTFQAEPYFFANSSKQTGKITFAWTLNGEDTTGPDSSRGIMTLRQTGAASGIAFLSLEVQNTDTDTFVQQASAGLKMVLGNPAPSAFSSLFGL